MPPLRSGPELHLARRDHDRGGGDRADRHGKLPTVLRHAQHLGEPEPMKIGTMNSATTMATFVSPSQRPGTWSITSAARLLATVAPGACRDQLGRNAVRRHVRGNDQRQRGDATTMALVHGLKPGRTAGIG